MKYVPHPGEILKDELEARGWSQRDLAYVLGLPEQSISRIIKGSIGISAAMSKKLGAALGISEELFTKLQSAYELAKAPDSDAEIISRKQRLECKINETLPEFKMLQH